MSAHTLNRDVLVVGGGVLGVSTAWHLALSGARVTLVTRGALADGASGRSLAWLNSAGPRSADYHRLRQLGIDRYRTFAARTDAARYLRFDGGLTWAGEGRSFEAVYQHERSIGYDVHRLRADEVAGWTPGVDVSTIPGEGALFHPGEGWVDLPSLIAELARRFAALGGTVIENAGAASVLVEGGRAVGARTASGERVEADAVVLATGPGVPEEVAKVGIRIEESTPTSLLVWTTPVQTELRAVLNTPRVALRPTPSGALAMDAGWSERSLIVHDDGSVVVPDGVVDTLLAEASRVLAGNPRLACDRVGIGRKPIPGDGEPVIGELSDIPGYFVAFSHSGATLGLIVGELLAEEIVTGRRSPLLESFHPSRFATAIAP